jgi:LemA protein
MKLRKFAVLGVVFLSGCGYNHIQELDEQVGATKSNVQTELLRRNDLIPNLVATVEEVAKFEKETYTQVAQARAGLTQATERMGQAAKQGNATPAELSQANAAVADNLRNYINISVEAYPQLRANQNFIALQDELTETENRLAVSRRDYNQSVQEYNTYIRRFPQNLTAKVIGAERKQTFEAPESTQQAPKVEFKR